MVLFCDIFEENVLVRHDASPREAIIALVNELEEYPPESWHVFLKLLRWQLAEHPPD